MAARKLDSIDRETAEVTYLLGGLEGLGVVDSAKTADITPEVPASVIYGRIPDPTIVTCLLNMAQTTVCPRKSDALLINACSPW